MQHCLISPPSSSAVALRRESNSSLSSLPSSSGASAPPPAVSHRSQCVRFSNCRSQHREFTVAAPDAAPEISASTAVPASHMSSGSKNGHRSPLAALLLPVAAACTILAGWPDSVEAGIFSGSGGLESLGLPSLPTPDVLKKIQESNVAKYKEFDSKFKKSPFLQGLLKKSEENKAMHKKEIEDKYCLRGAEWGVGDCSLAGMPQAERDAVMEMLRTGKVVDIDK